MQIKIHVSSVRILTNVQHVPGLTIFLWKFFDHKRYRYSVDGGVLKVKNVVMVVIK